MAQMKSTAPRDALTGGRAAETVRFALDGATYEIDLNKRNAAALRKLIGGYADAGRRIPRSRRRGAKSGRRRSTTSRGSSSTPSRTRGSRRAATTTSQADIRAWAVEQGIEVAARGRISNAVRDQYLAAHGR